MDMLTQGSLFFQFVLPVLIAFTACTGFCVIFNIRGTNLWFAAVGGAISWLTYLLCAGSGSEVFQCFAGGIVISLYAEIVARIRRTPSTCILIIGLLPLVPGAGVYYTMKYCVQGEYALFAEKGMSTLTAAGAIALGVMLVISIFRMLIHLRLHIRRKKKA